MLRLKRMLIDYGDIILIDPHFKYTKSGYVISCYIDDKAAVAALFVMLDYLRKNNLKPKYRTLLAFPLYKEIEYGGAYYQRLVNTLHWIFKETIALNCYSFSFCV